METPSNDAENSLSSGQLSQSLQRCALWVFCSTLLLLALGNLVWSIVAIADPREVMYGEAIIYAQADRILNGQALYQALDHYPYTVTAYTPLYYLAVARLHAALGSGFGPGRALSSVAGLVAMLCIWRLAAGRSGGWRTGSIAAVLFLALGFPGLEPWSALYKEDVLGVALSLAAILVVRDGRGAWSAALAGSLAALALLTKQTFVAATFAGLIWLWFVDRKRALAFAIADAALTVPLVCYLEASSHAFIANTITANLTPWYLPVVPYNLALLVAMQALPLIFAGVYVARMWRRRQFDDDLLLLYWGCTMLPLIGLARVGSSHNYWIEFAAVTSVLAARGVVISGLGCTVMRSGRLPVAVVAAVVVYLAIALPLIGITAIPRPTSISPQPLDAAAFQAVVDRVRIESGDVLADPLDVIALADKPIVFEPFVFSILYHEQQWNPTPMVQAVCSGRVQLLVLNYSLETAAARQGYGLAIWPEPVLQALQLTMHLERQQGDRFLYVWQPPRSGQPTDTVCRGSEQAELRS